MPLSTAKLASQTTNNVAGTPKLAKGSVIKPEKAISRNQKELKVSKSRGHTFLTSTNWGSSRNCFGKGEVEQEQLPEELWSDNLKIWIFTPAEDKRPPEYRIWVGGYSPSGRAEKWVQRETRWCSIARREKTNTWEERRWFVDHMKLWNRPESTYSMERKEKLRALWRKGEKLVLPANVVVIGLH